MVREYTLRLHGIRFRTNLGASHSERSLPQEIVVDVELTLPASALPSHDQRRDAVDYDAVANVVVEEGRRERYRLLETYAQRLVARLLAETPALTVRVAATKMRVPTSQSVDRAIVELVAARDGDIVQRRSDSVTPRRP
jgi:dihydroneopterin aldolase